MKLTFVTCTARREPRFDWAADSLARSLASYHIDHEWIVVDDILWHDPGRVNQLGAAVFAANCTYEVKLNVKHITPKPSPWRGPYRITSKDYFALNNARNTAICHATGDHVVFFDDCTVLDIDFVLWHARVAARGVALAGSYTTYHHAIVDRGQVLQGELHDAQDHRGDTERIAPGGGWLYGLNMSMPLASLLITNGYDERFDGQPGGDDCYQGILIERARFTVLYLPQCKIYQILETHEDISGHEGWGKATKGRQKELLLPDGKMHFANEWLIYSLCHHEQNRIRSENDFDIRELRDKIQNGGCFPTQRGTEVDWRDGQPLREM